MILEAGVCWYKVPRLQEEAAGGGTVATGAELEDPLVVLTNVAPGERYAGTVACPVVGLM